MRLRGFRGAAVEIKEDIPDLSEPSYSCQSPDTFLSPSQLEVPINPEAPKLTPCHGAAYTVTPSMSYANSSDKSKFVYIRLLLNGRLGKSGLQVLSPGHVSASPGSQHPGPRLLAALGQGPGKIGFVFSLGQGSGFFWTLIKELRVGA